MMPVRLALVAALVAAAVIVTLPVAGAEEQYPRGLMSAQPTSHYTCTIDVRPVSFGNYNAIDSRALDAIGQVIYVCGNLHAGTAAPDNKAIRIELTTGSANQFSPRGMVGPSNIDPLGYNLYLDPTHNTIWGQGAFGTDTYYDPKPPNKTPVMVPIYGRVFANQDVPAGQYGDIVTARILF
jgi:spore coat protein U-like protein